MAYRTRWFVSTNPRGRPTYARTEVLTITSSHSSAMSLTNMGSQIFWPNIKTATVPKDMCARGRGTPSSTRNETVESKMSFDG